MLPWNRILHELNLTPLIEMIKGKQDKLIAGENIDITDNVISAVGGSGGTTNYNLLSNKPSINGVELEGNKTTAQLGLNYNDLINKPDLFSGDYNDLTNRPDLFSGDYNDLTNKPTIPTVNNGTLTIRENGVTKGSFTANQFGDTTIDLTGGGDEPEIVELTQAQYDALEQSGQLDPDVAYFINDATGGTLGTAAYKDYTDRVRPNNFGLVESHAVYSAINSALSSIYTPRGNVDCADLTSALLIEANIGNVYETNDSGTTSALFIQGAGHTINAGDNVGIIRAGADIILFNLMGNAFDLTNYQTKDDANLDTTSKNIVGAINEVFNSLPVIKTGSIGLTSGNQSGTGSVTFATPFDTVPTVVANYKTPTANSPYVTEASVMIMDVTVNGFDFKYKTDKTLSMTQTLSWIAIGS